MNITNLGDDKFNPVQATLSVCGAYRYSLMRQWDGTAQKCCWIMLNPSTADAFQDDPTIRRCMAFAKAWGFGGIVVVNLFALRSANPAALLSHADPVGPENDEHIRRWIGALSLTIAAWGAEGKLRNRAAAIMAMARGAGAALNYLRKNKDGQPGHPLYLPSSLKPQVLA